MIKESTFYKKHIYFHFIIDEHKHNFIFKNLINESIADFEITHNKDAEYIYYSCNTHGVDSEIENVQYVVNQHSYDDLESFMNNCSNEFKQYMLFNCDLMDRLNRCDEFYRGYFTKDVFVKTL